MRCRVSIGIALVLMSSNEFLYGWDAESSCQNSLSRITGFIASNRTLPAQLRFEIDVISLALFERLHPISRTAIQPLEERYWKAVESTTPAIRQQAQNLYSRMALLLARVQGPSSDRFLMTALGRLHENMHPLILRKIHDGLTGIRDQLNRYYQPNATSSATGWARVLDIVGLGSPGFRTVRETAAAGKIQIQVEVMLDHLISSLASPDGIIANLSREILGEAATIIGQELGESRRFGSSQDNLITDAYNRIDRVLAAFAPGNWQVWPKPKFRFAPSSEKHQLQPAKGHPSLGELPS